MPPSPIRELLPSDLPDAEKLRQELVAPTAKVQLGPWGAEDFFRRRLGGQGFLVLGAEAQGKLQGASFVHRQGSLAVLGPLWIRQGPHLSQLGKALLDRQLEAASGCAHVVSFTYHQAAPMLDLYRRCDLWPRFLTIVLARKTREGLAAPAVTAFSKTSPDARGTLLARADALAARFLPGHQVSTTLAALDADLRGQDLVVLDEQDGTSSAAWLELVGAQGNTPATCHLRYAATSGTEKAAFDRLLLGVEAFAHAQGAQRISVGVNLVHQPAYEAVQALGYNTVYPGVALHLRNAAPYQGERDLLAYDWH